jgi:hypothetical protein
VPVLLDVTECEKQLQVTAIILSDNYQVQLPVGLLIELIKLTQLTAHNCSRVAARGNKLQLSDTDSPEFRIFRVNLHSNQEKHYNEVREMTYSTLQF